MKVPPPIRRWLWRRARRFMVGSDVSAAPQPGIERFSLFQGSLRIAGEMAAPAAVRDLALELPGGERLPLAFSQVTTATIRFDAVLAVRAPIAEVALAVLEATLVDGRIIRQTGLGTSFGDPAHALSERFRTALAAQAPGRLLEIGARARSGIVRRDWAPAGWEYSGFDIHPGPNVDVVGDAHALSGHYAEGAFDAVMAFSVLEHLLMPWKFVLELNRILKTGAIGLFTTHQCWPLHDQPWDYWRFSDAAWTGLLNPATGFEIIDAQMGEPAFVVAQRCSPQTAFPERATGRLASNVLFRKTGPTTLDWPVDLASITRTSYPEGEVQVA